MIGRKLGTVVGLGASLLSLVAAGCDGERAQENCVYEGDNLEVSGILVMYRDKGVKLEVLAENREEIPVNLTPKNIKDIRCSQRASALLKGGPGKPGYEYTRHVDASTQISSWSK